MGERSVRNAEVEGSIPFGSTFGKLVLSYQVLARKYRPEKFQDVLGQGHVTQTLLNAFERERIAHAYLFAGPRGVGKTTTARILAKALNCLTDANGNPCNECNNCQEIASSRSMDVLEIDGASNRGIDEIRNLRELVKYSPINVKFKVFIIDEVHMLTQAAFNALLKTLEEPPPHVKFIFATTEANKVLPTILSRCQRHDFHRMSLETIRAGLEAVVEAENVQMEESVYHLIGTTADGSMRDALSLADQLIAFCGHSITLEAATEMLGIIPSDLFFSITDALKVKDRSGLLDQLTEVHEKGFAQTDFINGLNRHLLNLLIATGEKGADLLDVTDDLKERYSTASSEWKARDLIRYLDHVTKMESEIKRVQQPKVFLEAMMLKLAEMDSSVEISDLLDKLSGGNPVSTSQPVKAPPPQLPPKEKPAVKDSPPPKEEPPQEEKASEPAAEPEQKKADAVSDSGPELSLDSVRQKWEEVVGKVSENGTSIGTFLSHGEPAEVTGRRVTIGFPERYRFQLDVLKKNSRRIEMSLEKVFHKELKVDFVLQKGNESSAELSNSDHPVTQRVLELFGGEMTN